MFERRPIRSAAALLAAALTLVSFGLAAQEGETASEAPQQETQENELQENGATAQESRPSFDQVAGSILRDLDGAREELTALRERAREEKLPLRNQLAELQAELVAAEAELRRVTRLRNEGAAEFANLTRTVDTRRAETQVLRGIFDDYINRFASRIHISEVQRYGDVIEGARSAPDNASLTQSEVFAQQVKIFDAALERLFDTGGGVKFDGTAVDSTGVVRDGSFVLVGPTAIFRSKDGAVVGTAEQINSLEPTIMSFDDPLDAEAAALVVETGAGAMPFDVSLGNAHKIAATKETLVEHVQKGGAIIYPILIMAAIALLVAVARWVVLASVRRPRRRAVDALMESIREGDEESAQRRAQEIKGPVGRMLEVGVENVRRSRDLMEEVMYEKVLVTKRAVNKGLPFIAVCAASAPLLGLLGTVTGIINTFKQITVFGSGDVKQLSGGISEALITTKFGLIVAIPSLLLHAYLSRKARGVVTDMESNAIRLANEVAKSDAFGEGSYVVPGRPSSMLSPDHEMVRGQVAAVLTDMLGPLSNEPQAPGVSPSTSADEGVGA